MAAFTECASLTNVVLPKYITAIRDTTFRGAGLVSVEIPDGVTVIERSAFADCNSLKSVVIPSKVTSIGDFAFNVCLGMTSIEIPASVTSIGEWAFPFVGYEGSLMSSVFTAFIVEPGSYAEQWARNNEYGRILVLK